MSHARSTELAKHYRKAAELSFKEGTGLSYLMHQRCGLMRPFWHFRDIVLYEGWKREDYVMALCLLATLAEQGDLPNGP